MPFTKDDPNINRDGRPKGSVVSIVSVLKKKLLEAPPGSELTYLELLVERILKEAIQEGNDYQIKNILQYVEGMPRQTVDGTFRHTWFEELKESLGIDTASISDEHFRDVDLDDLPEETLPLPKDNSETDS